MNDKVLGFLGVNLEKREAYAIKYVEEMLAAYTTATKLDISKFVFGIGHRKSLHQKQYQEMQSYLERLKNYASHIEICGESRNSYSKTDHDATFMHIKRDYMGNDQFHHEIITNPESIHGALLCMNRRIQSEGTFGIIKWVIIE